jgi:hypothetical protein
MPRFTLYRDLPVYSRVKTVSAGCIMTRTQTPEKAEAVKKVKIELGGIYSASVASVDEGTGVRA